MVFETADIFTVLLLIFLEGILSVDNALVLAILAKQVEPRLRQKALTYGIVGAIVFRFLALFLVTKLIHFAWIKWVGGGYLTYVALKHWIGGDDAAKAARGIQGLPFWRVVFVIELTDIAFAVDSILAAAAISNKLWVVFTGGVIGLILMRFAAGGFIKLLDKFPSFEQSAYLLIFLVGAKLLLDGFKLPGFDFHSSASPAFWIFWSLMLAAIAFGFTPYAKKAKKVDLKLLDKETNVFKDEGF